MSVRVTPSPKPILSKTALRKSVADERWAIVDPSGFHWVLVQARVEGLNLCAVASDGMGGWEPCSAEDLMFEIRVRDTALRLVPQARCGAIWTTLMFSEFGNCWGAVFLKRVPGGIENPIWKKLCIQGLFAR